MTLFLLPCAAGHVEELPSVLEGMEGAEKGTGAGS